MSITIYLHVHNYFVVPPPVVWLIAGPAVAIGDVVAGPSSSSIMKIVAPPVVVTTGLEEDILMVNCSLVSIASSFKISMYEQCL
jgi:hypothetical protein